jgi:hypothetical protein
MLSEQTYLKQTGNTDRSKAGKPAMLFSPLSLDATKSGAEEKPDNSSN